MIREEVIETLKDYGDIDIENTEDQGPIVHLTLFNGKKDRIIGSLTFEELVEVVAKKQGKEVEDLLS